MSFPRRFIIPILVPMLLLLAPTSSGAATLCAKPTGDPDPAPDCSPGGVYADASPYQAMKFALADAAISPAADRLVLGNATYDGNGAFYNAGSDLEIVGESKAGVVLTSGVPLTSNQFILLLNSGANVTVRDLTLRAAGYSAASSYGIQAINAGARLVNLKLEDPIPNADGVGALVHLQNGARLEDSTVDNRLGAGVRLDRSFITNTRFNGGGFANTTPAIVTAPDGGVVRRSHFQGYGVFLEHSGTAVPAAAPTVAQPLVLEDSVFDLGARAGAVGARMNPSELNAGSETQTALITFRRTTVVGTGTNQRFVKSEPSITAGTSPGKTFVTIDSTLVDLTGGGSALVECDANGPGAPTNPVGVHNITASNSSFTAPLINTDGTCDMTATGTVAAPPTWQDAATYTLRWDAPQRDAGDPAAALLPEAIDFTGLARLRDGNGDGAARVDIGAVEYQPTAPVIGTVTPAAPATVQVSQPLQFTAVATDALAEGALSYQWTFDGKAATPGASVSQTFATAGVHSATITVRDGAGTPTSQTFSVVVAAAPKTNPTPIPPVSPTDATAPRFATPLAPTAAFQRTGTGLVRVARGTRATAIRFIALERVRVQFRWRTLAGRTIGPITTIAGVPAGTRWLKWGGRIGARTMAPGCYRLQARALDAAGNASPWRSVRVCLAR